MTIASLPFAWPTPAVDPDVRSRQGQDFHAGAFGLEPEPFSPRPAHDSWNERPTLLESLVQAILKQGEYPWDSKNPRGPLRKLYFRVRDYLPNKIRGHLHLMCALGTTADTKFGIDGFFVLENAPLCASTFDLSLSGGWLKRRSLKAHFLITMRDLACDSRIAHLGKAIAKHLMSMHAERRLRRQQRNKRRRRRSRRRRYR